LVVICDSKLYMALPVLTHAISNNGGFGEFGGEINVKNVYYIYGRHEGDAVSRGGCIQQTQAAAAAAAEFCLRRVSRP